jgi:hypothetical protein
VARILFLLLVVLFAAGCAGQTTAIATSLPATNTPLPSSTPTSPATATILPTVTPVPPELAEQLDALHMAMFLIQVDAELLAEAALRVQSGDLDSAGRVGVFTAIGQYADTVDQVASTVPVPEALSPAWDEAFEAHTETRTILSRWSNGEIDPEHVIAQVEAARQSAAHALQVAEQWFAQIFAADTTGLAAAREEALARMINRVFEPTPTASP